MKKLFSTLKNNRGVALVLSLLVLALMGILGATALVGTQSGLRVAHNDHIAKTAFAIAEGGIEYARERVRTQLMAGNTLTQQLANAANGGALVNSTSLNSFNRSTGMTNNTTNAPIAGSISFGAGAFQVFLTNDRNEPAATTAAQSVQLLTDTNDLVTLTSFGTGPNNALAVVQEEIQLFPLPDFPAPITLPGPDVVFSPNDSNAHLTSGDDIASSTNFPTVSVTSTAVVSTVATAIDATKPNTWTSGPPFNTPGGQTVEKGLAESPYDLVNTGTPNSPMDPRLIQVSYLASLTQALTAAADFTSASDPGFTLGTTTDPKVVAINGNASFTGNISGAGILLVTGNLTLSGNFSYNGYILVMGNGSLTINGSGNGTILGTIFVANTTTPFASDPTLVGIPTFQINGGGNGTIRFDSGSTALAKTIMPLQRVSFQGLRN